MMIILDNKEIAYETVGKYVKEYWNEHGWDDAIVQMEISYDGIKWAQHRQIICPNGRNAEWLRDWWEGEKYIRILNIINIDELNIEREHYNATN